MENTNNKVKFVAQFLIFFFVFVLVFTFGFLFSIVYPAMGLDIRAIYAEITTTIIVTTLVCIAVCIILYRLLKPVESIINNRQEGTEISGKEKNTILRTEKISGLIIIFTTVLGYFIAPSTATVITMIKEGFLRWSTVRFVIVCYSMGPAVAVCLILYLGSLMQKIKIKGNIFEFYDKGKKAGIRTEMIFIMLSFVLPLVVVLSGFAMAKEEGVTGLSSVALRFRPVSEDTSNGILNRLIALSLESTDPAVRNEARAVTDSMSPRLFESGIIIVGFGVLVFLIIGLFIFFYSSNIASHLKGITATLSTVVELKGDMTNLLVKTSSNEIGEIQVLFNRLILNLNKTLENIFSIATVVIAESREEHANMERLINSNNEVQKISREAEAELAGQTEITRKQSEVVKSAVAVIAGNIERISRQSEMVSESSAAVEEMNASIKSVAKATDSASRLSEKLEGSTLAGTDVSKAMQNAIEEISRYGAGINEIAETISSITDQTDLLAMNAAIEAAHAGEFGKGFAVVADEIKKLAENTSEQTKEIETSIRAISKSVTQSVECSADLSEVISGMTFDIRDTIRLIQEIFNNTKEQLQASDETLSIMLRLVDMTKEVKDSLAHESSGNELLLEAMVSQERSVERVNAIAKRQDGYIRGLRIHLGNFLDYFNRTAEQLAALEKLLKGVKLLDSAFLSDPDREAEEIS